MPRLRRLVVAGVLLLTVPTCVASAGSGGTADLGVVSVTAKSAVIRVGDQFEVRMRLSNAGPDATDCALTATTPHTGPLIAPYNGYRVVGDKDIAPIHCFGAGPTNAVAPAESRVENFDVVGVRPGVATVRVAISSADPSPAADPNPSNNAFDVRVRVLPAKKTFTELRDPVFSPDGKTIAYVRWSQPKAQAYDVQPATTGRVWIATANGTNAHPVTPQMTVPRRLSWSPDNNRIVFSNGATSMIVNVRTRARIALGPGLAQPTWSPDGTRIAYLTVAAHGGEVDVIPASGGPPTYVAPYGGTPGDSRGPVWSPDSRYVQVYSTLYPSDGSGGSVETDAIGWSRDGTLELTRDNAVVNVATGRVLRTVPALVRPQLAPDGTAVAGTTVVGGRVRIALVKTATTTYAPAAQSAHDTVSWSPRHELAYVGSGRCGLRSQIDVVQSNGSGFRVIARSCSP